MQQPGQRELGNRHRSSHLLERSLQKATMSIGHGWDLEIIEAIVENYHVDFADQTEQTLNKIELALRDILGSAADIFIDKFYSELRRAGFPNLP